MSEQVRLSFQRWDVDGTGIILKHELVSLLRFLNPKTTDEEIGAVFSAAQIGPDDKIRYDRFVSWMFMEDFFSQLGITQFSLAIESKCLWELALNAAVTNTAKMWPKAKADSYFAGVRTRIMEPEFADHVQRLAEQCCDGWVDNVNFEQALRLADSGVQCCSHMAATAMPTPNEIRIAFDVHDIKAGGQGRLPGNELVNLMRYLQVRVAWTTLMETEAEAAKNLELLKSNAVLRENGLWQGTISGAKAKAYQRFAKADVDSYFDKVEERLSGPEYEAHVRGAFFTQVDTNKDGKVSFDEASGLIISTLVCSADLAGAQKPTKESIREVFDAHDTIVQGWDFMGEDEFLNLMRYLQVHVAEAMLPLSLEVKPDVSASGAG